VKTINVNGMILFTNTLKSCTAASAVLLSLVLSGGPAPGEIIPSDRTAPWQDNVGVPGGIPHRTTIWKNIVTDLGADRTGQVDAGPIIQGAVNRCPAGKVVYMPAGTFKIATGVVIQNKSNITLRGAGQGQTVWKIATGAVPLLLRGVEPWPPPTDYRAIIAGATKGSNTVTVGDTSGISVDSLILVMMRLPSWGHRLGGFPDSQLSYDSGMGGVFKVRSVTSSTVTIDPRLPFDFSAMGPMLLPTHATTLMGVGIESFTIDQSDVPRNVNFPSIQMGGAYGCWWSDIELKNNPGRTAIIGTSVRCEFRRLYGHQTFVGGPNHEGLDFTNNACWNLVEDNIFSPGTTPFFGDGGGHCMGNVVAYNYITRFQGGTWDVTFNHGPHNMLNLCEGNVFQNSFKDDGYFGSSSHNTLFRNSIPDQVILKHFSNYYNVVGNILGATPPGSGQTRTYDAGEVNHYFGTHAYPIYELGFPNIGNDGYNDTFINVTDPPNYRPLGNTLDQCQQLDRNVRNTILRHGNFDHVNNYDLGPGDSRPSDTKQLVFERQTIVVGGASLAADRPRSESDGRPHPGAATF